MIPILTRPFGDRRTASLRGTTRNASARARCPGSWQPALDPWEVAGGNYIVIQHANGEYSHYSHYAHLAHGSVRVRRGQPVTQGEPIARVGGTGEAPVVHLHFEVTDSADAEHYAFHSIPVDFTNVAPPPNSRPSDEHGYFLVAH
jgi:murein DD-endopeptidase MepM/ murein hydrolase activator NlpD